LSPYFQIFFFFFFFFFFYSCCAHLSIGHPWNASFHISFLILYTDGGVPWTTGQPVARPLPNTNTK
jgi:hypothetical protein